MTFTITSGWWLAPVAVTIATWVYCLLATKDQSSGAYGFGGFFTMVYYVVFWIVPSLVAWLIWAIFR